MNSSEGGSVPSILRRSTRVIQNQSIFENDESSNGSPDENRRLRVRPSADEMRKHYSFGCERETRKREHKSYKEVKKGRNQMRVYDDKGILLISKKDLCDCMVSACPGCHFPCPKCRSNKCGTECRQNRKFQYESAEEEGNKLDVLINPNMTYPIPKLESQKKSA